MEIYLQIILNSICSGLVLSLVAIGFSYIFYVTKVFHLAHASMYAMSGLTTWAMYQVTSSFLVSLAASIMLSLMLIVLIEKLVYLPLYLSKADQSISLISSMGIYVVLVNLLALIFGNENKVLDVGGEALAFGKVLMTPAQKWQFAASAIAIVMSFLVLKRKNLNLDLRAVSDSDLISSILGINIRSRRMYALLFGTILVSLASWLKTIEVGIEPHSGMTLVLTAAVVSILVTRLNVFLILAGAIVLSIVQNVIEWNLNAQWRDGLTFFALLLVILFKTEGLISYNLRRDTA